MRHVERTPRIRARDSNHDKGESGKTKEMSPFEDEDLFVAIHP